MSLQYIREHYGVPAKRGGRVKYTGSSRRGPEFGTITGANGAHVRIRIDGEKLAGNYHPTYALEYL